MKKTAILMILAFCLLLNGCCSFGLGDLELPELDGFTLPGLDGMHMVRLETAPAEEVLIPTYVPETQDQTEPEPMETEPVPMETVPVETEPEGSVVELDRSGQYTINIFLSNFSEAWFDEYGTAGWEAKTQAQRTYQLVQFVHTHYKINSEKTLYKAESDYGESLSLKEINDKLKRYVGVSVTMEQIEATDLIVENNRVHWWSAAGESYANFSVADSMTELPDGTYRVDFTVYTVEKYASGGNSIAGDKTYYYYTPAKAASDSGVTKRYTGTALVEPYTHNGKATYRLISYEPGR